MGMAPEDIPILVEHFLRKYEPKLGRRRISREAMECLLRYPWPGNVRELENAIHRAMVMVPSEEIAPDALPRELVEEWGRRRTRSSAPPRREPSATERFS